MSSINDLIQLNKFNFLSEQPFDKKVTFSI